MSSPPSPCRFCRAPLALQAVDLGMSPLANSYREPGDLRRMEPFYPVVAWVCERCWLVQLEELESPAAIFGRYAYFSSYSASWVAHARAYAEMAIARFGLGAGSRVVEVASNDGYLLQHFAARGIPVLGIEPAANVAAAAEGRGIPTRVAFFGAAAGRQLREEGRGADLLVANNVLAHVPDINDFAEGLREALGPGGVLTLEFHHLLRLLAENQFDTIYHEHFSYLSLRAARRVLAAHGLTVFDVEELPTHGGSLRVYARHAADRRWPVSERMEALSAREEAAGLERAETYAAFGERVREARWALVEALIGRRREGKRIAGYGAAAKGVALLNYCGIGADLIEYVVDLSPHKQGRFVPGTRIPIHPPERLAATRPECILILPWNLREEITAQLGAARGWGAEFLVPIPEVKVC